MRILIVDDTPESCHLLEAFLNTAGYNDIVIAHSEDELFEILDVDGEKETDISLILLDIYLPESVGLDACRKIKSDPRFEDLPIIIITSSKDETLLETAFEAGAVDFINKPVSRVELRSRVRSALSLKEEMERRKELLTQVEKANAKLLLLSSQDGLTGLPNRRHFDQMIDKEWRRSVRHGLPMSFIIIDIDFFKLYNDTYGHQYGDDCLKSVAEQIKLAAKRPGDIPARYGGEEFVLILAETGLDVAKRIAEDLRREVVAMKILHESSRVSEYVTISLGVASMVPHRNSSPEGIIRIADEALYLAKHEGRNSVRVGKSEA